MKARRGAAWVLRSAGIAAGLAVLSGCALLGLGGPEERWEAVRVAAVGAEDLWVVVSTSLDRADFPRVEIDRAAGTASTGWFVSLFPYSGQGYRERAHVRLEKEREGTWLVRVRVERQKNKAVTRPLAPTEDDWKGDDDDSVRARLVARRVAAALGGPARAGGSPR